jgi:hypothetical protein
VEKADISVATLRKSAKSARQTQLKAAEDRLAVALPDRDEEEVVGSSGKCVVRKGF